MPVVFQSRGDLRTSETYLIININKKYYNVCEPIAYNMLFGNTNEITHFCKMLDDDSSSCI